MIGENELTVLAEVGIGLAGFSGIVLALRQRNQDHPWARYRALGVLTTSFHVLFLALLPFVVHAFGVTGHQLWRLSSAIGLVLTLPSPIALRKIEPEGFQSSAFYKPMSMIAFGIAIPAYGALIVNIFAIGTEGAFSLYLLAVVLTLLIAVPQFISVLIAPSHE